MGRNLVCDTVMCHWSTDILFWQLSIDHNMDVQYQVTGSHTSWKVRDFTLVARSCDYQDFSRIDNKIFLPMGHWAPRSRRAPLIKVCPLYFQPQTIMKYIPLIQFRSNYKSNKAHSHFWIIAAFTWTHKSWISRFVDTLECSASHTVALLKGSFRVAFLALLEPLRWRLSIININRVKNGENGSGTNEYKKFTSVIRFFFEATYCARKWMIITNFKVMF